MLRARKLSHILRGTNMEAGILQQQCELNHALLFKDAQNDRGLLL